MLGILRMLSCTMRSVRKSISRFNDSLYVPEPFTFPRLDCPPNHDLILGIGLLQGMYERKGDLAIGQVVAGILTKFVCVRPVIEFVVNDLERNSDIQSKFRQGNFSGRSRLGEYRTQLG